jgi:hypothetical protein
MSRPIIIETARPSVEETAHLLRIPKKEVKSVRSLIDRWANSAETLRVFGDPSVDSTPTPRRKPGVGKRSPSKNGHH